jgi:RNA binding exosome subunit
MGSIPLHYIDLRAFRYATEAEDRVEQALRTVLPEEYPIDRTESKGHHGDRIVVLSARVDNADDMRAVLDRVRSVEAIETVRNELDQRVTDNCELFLTLDKAAAYRGTVRLGDGIRLRAKIEAYPAKRESAIQNARAVLDA